LKNDVKYQASAQPFLVFGMLTAGIALGHGVI
jgi:chlorophyll/bacteriochlorophyll a synthase